MVNKYSTLFVTFKDGSEYLVRKGKYETRINANNETSMETIEDPIYKAATKSTVMSYAFLENALNLDDRGKSQRPKCPRGQNIHHWKKSPRGRIADRWNTATDNEKIQVELMAYCHDQGLLLTSFELL